MARRKAPENETVEQAADRKAREEISNHATRSEKVSWERQYGNLQKVLETKLQPLENQILDLVVEKNKIYDEMVVLRDELIRDCIHPFEHVAHQVTLDGEATGIYICHFCNKKVALNDVTK